MIFPPKLWLAKLALKKGKEHTFNHKISWMRLLEKVFWKHHVSDGLLTGFKIFFSSIPIGGTQKISYIKSLCLFAT